MISTIIKTFKISAVICLTGCASLITNPTTYVLSGDITGQSFEDFKQYISKHNVNEVILDSNGGDLIEAIKIGEVIHNRGIDTTVPKGVLCASACGYIFLSGDIKTLRGSIGMHEVSFRGRGYNTLTLEEKEEILVTTLVVSNYLGYIGVSLQFFLDNLNTYIPDLQIVESPEELNQYIVRGNLVVK